MHKFYFFLLLLILTASGCKTEQDPFLISRKSIGLLTDSTKIKDLKMVFPNDSIVHPKNDSKFRILSKTIEIYEKGGNLLLTLTPRDAADLTSTINHIRVEDSRFKTDQGISRQSEFKDIQEVYKISKIDNLLNSLVVSVNEIDAQFAIDKNQLPANLRHDMNMTIEASQIPDHAKIKYFFVNWD